MMKRRNVFAVFFAVFCLVCGIAIKFFLVQCCGIDMNADQLARLEINASNGDRAAMKELRFYYAGKQEYENEYYWLEHGAKAGDAGAQYHLSDALFARQDIDSRELGMKYLLLAAENGEQMAQKELGKRFRDGNLVVRDDAKAVLWLKKAAKSGSADSA